MPSFVSKDHKEMIRRLRTLWRDVQGDPGPEVNLGYLCGVTNVNLRADAFIRIDEDTAVAIEWQSEIHTEEGCESEWFNYDDIAGRDDLKRQLCAKAGVGLVELWTLELSDEMLEQKILDAAETSHLTATAIQALDKEDDPTFTKTEDGFAKAENSFVPSDQGFSPSDRKIGGEKKPEWGKTAFGGRSSFNVVE